MIDATEWTKVVKAYGYEPEAYHVDIEILSEHNQVLIITDIPNMRRVEVPYEENLLEWKQDKLGWEIVRAIEKADRNLQII